jgi:hypothetical protein
LAAAVMTVVLTDPLSFQKTLHPWCHCEFFI